MPIELAPLLDRAPKVTPSTSLCGPAGTVSVAPSTGLSVAAGPVGASVSTGVAPGSGVGTVASCLPGLGAGDPSSGNAAKSPGLGAGSTAAAVFPPGEIESPAGVFALGERLRALRRVRLDGAFDEREGIIK